MEEAIIPEICAVGGDLLSGLATWYVGAILRPAPLCMPLTRHGYTA